MAKLKITQVNSATNAQVDNYISPITINGTNIGGTGGNTSITTPATIRASFYLGSTLYTGYIKQQKGERKHRVVDTTGANTTTASIVNLLASELSTANTMTILANVNTITGANIANVGAATPLGLTNRTSAYVTWVSGNVTGYATPSVNHQLSGTGLTGNVTVVAVNSSTNVTVSCTTQTVTNAQANIGETFNVKTLTNKYVTDWANTKWRYYLGAPYTTGAAVLASQPAWQAVTLVRVDNA